MRTSSDRLRLSLVACLLSIGWMVPWLMALGTARLWWIPPVVGVGTLALAQTRAGWLWSLPAALAGMALGFGVGRWYGGLGAGLAAWGGWASADPNPHTGLQVRLGLFMTGLTGLVLWRPSWWPALLVGVGGGMAIMAEAHRPRRFSGLRWYGLVLSLALASIGLAFAVWGAAQVLPRARLPAWSTYRGPGYDDQGVRYISGSGSPTHDHGSVRPVYAPNVLYRILHGRSQLARLLSHGFPVWLWAAGLGLALFALGLWWRRRWLARWDSGSDDVAAGSEPRARIPASPMGLAAGETDIVQHTRRWVKSRMQRASQTPHRYQPYETVREWLRRVYGDQAVRSAVVLYEEVRYGRVPDSAERAAAVARLWPRKPKGNGQNRK